MTACHDLQRALGLPVGVTPDMGDGKRRIEEFPELPSGVNPAPREFLASHVEVPA